MYGTRVVVLLAVGLLASGSSQALLAQGGGRGAGQGFGQPFNMTELTIKAAIEHADEVGVDEERLVQLREMDEEITEAMKEINEELAALRQNARSGGAGGGMREQMMEMRARADEIQKPFAEKLGELLTEEQLEKAESLVPRPQGRGGAPPSPGVG